jgi:GNAT superfamily N-acetyltransferase
VTIAEDANGEIAGAYIIHPNYPSRLGGICNASFAVRKAHRGKHIGEKLVKDCIEKAKTIGFRITQFYAIIEINKHAQNLYERLGFVQSGTVPAEFHMKDGRYANICQYYLKL